jgi:uncharacterized protein (DUF2236 family)
VRVEEALKALEGRPGPGSVVHKINRETVLLLGWGRAILLQLAHPLVAAGVAEHSLFYRHPRGRVRRLRHTLQAMLDLTFGTPDEVLRAARGINAIHDRVEGALPAAEGPFPAGRRYSAHDPALLRWVHATLLDSLPLAYERFVGPLTAAERDAYCAEASGIEPLLGLPSGSLPRDTAALRRYMDGMYAGGEIVVGETARRLARELLAPPLAPGLPGLGRLGAALGAVLHLPTVGLLPPRVREAYGLTWGPRREALLRASAAGLRGLLRVSPPALRHWAPARRAQASDRGAPAPAGVPAPGV